MFVDKKHNPFLPFLQDFVYNVASKFKPKLEVEFISHAIPTIEFFDAKGDSLGEKEKLEPYTSNQIRDALKARGFPMME